MTEENMESEDRRMLVSTTRTVNPGTIGNEALLSVCFLAVRDLEARWGSVGEPLDWRRLCRYLLRAC